MFVTAFAFGGSQETLIMEKKEMNKRRGRKERKGEVLERTEKGWEKYRWLLSTLGEIAVGKKGVQDYFLSS